MHVWESMGLYICMHCPQMPEESIGSPRARITGSCEPSDMDYRNQTRISAVLALNHWALLLLLRREIILHLPSNNPQSLHSLDHFMDSHWLWAATVKKPKMPVHWCGFRQMLAGAHTQKTHTHTHNRSSPDGCGTLCRFSHYHWLTKWLMSDGLKPYVRETESERLRVTPPP